MNKDLINRNELEHFCSSFLYNWKKAFTGNQYELCSSVSDDLINQLKPIYKTRAYGEGLGTGLDYTYIYLFLMLAKGLTDIISLVHLTKDKSWPEQNSKVETIWQLLWDAKERIDIFNSHCYETDILESLYEQLEKLEYNFYDIFGKGLYMSPVILIKKAICTICGLNIKSCIHIPGNLYEGKYCKEQAQEIELQGADIVQSPQDMRCRIWPWNFTDENHINARIMNLNKLDGFIDEE